MNKIILKHALLNAIQYEGQADVKAVVGKIFGENPDFKKNMKKTMEKFIYCRANALTVHSSGNKEYVVANGASLNTTTVVHNWVDTDLIKPGKRENDFSKEYKLQDKFVISFAGVMGFAQGLEVVIKAADMLKRHRTSDLGHTTSDPDTGDTEIRGY